MKTWTTFRSYAAGALLASLAVITTASLFAQPPKLPSLPGRGGDAAAQPAAGNANAGSPGAAPAKKSDGSEFIIPENATPDQLFEMANKLLNTEQSFGTEAEYNAWVKKMVQTVYTIANKILKMNVDDETYKKAIALKGEMIYYHVWANADAFPKYEKFIEEIQKDPLLLKADGGQKVIDGQVVSFLHEKCIRAVQAGGSADDIQKSIDEFRAIVMRDPEFVSMIPSFVYPVSQMATEKKDPKILKDAFLKFATDMKKSDDKTLNDAANGLMGLLRFAELEGKPLKVVGTTVSGAKFDPDSLKGKVFLLNFWATWVTPCIAQYPELLALYIQYHDKGFEIVGYNMDTELDKFKDYVAQKNVPWENLSEQMSTDNKQPSMAEFYGITTMPTLILVGKDGNVIKNDVDIDTLKKLLAEQLK
ncbi:MAG: TlpA family protein disulfide reductase [Thermoguttaceae bacterium]|nr:TlpA family protein disulfide reductase [Thermoguttaceae bacterium]